MAGYGPKLIEVALPLAAINAAAAREKSNCPGHPSTLHLWWARRPVAVARAMIWASLVDDPSGDPSLSAAEQDAERARLFGILAELVRWENSNDAGTLAAARAEIDRCFPEGPPPILDPFAGGGTIPSEAQRLGLTALAGDLNPVAALINRAMIEIPPHFAGRPPIHPDLETELTTWERAQGLAADVAAYGGWMRDEAHRRIGHLYPQAASADGEPRTPIAWIWARTVPSPDPAWRGQVPLVASWVLATPKTTKPRVWVEPIIDRDAQTISYEVRHGGEPTHERTVKGGRGRCIATGAAITGDHIKTEGRAGRMGQQLMAVVVDGEPGRAYCTPTGADEAAARVDEPDWKPTQRVTEPNHAVDRLPMYGMATWGDAFSPRQLVALTTFSDLLREVREQVVAAADACGFGGESATGGGSDAGAYADAVVTYLALAVDKCADSWSTVCTWHNSKTLIRNTFGRQAIPMTWDFAECNPFSLSTGSWSTKVDSVREALEHLPASVPGEVAQRDARATVRECTGRPQPGGAPVRGGPNRRARAPVIATDPPYYNNVLYADISDFFFVWLRHNLSDIWPDECDALLTPKEEELIANRFRASSKEEAHQHFESGIAEFVAEVARHQPADVPATMHYVYQAIETPEGEVRATRWDTFLQALVDAGLQVNATWPMRTDTGDRSPDEGVAALASSILLACRPRPVDAPVATRAEFVAALRASLPRAIRVLQYAGVAPVDMAQSTIGPGMKVFSRYAAVIDADGATMQIPAALATINDVLSEIANGT